MAVIIVCRHHKFVGARWLMTRRRVVVWALNFSLIMHFSYFFLLFTVFFNKGYCELVNSKLDRNIDIASQLVKVLIKLTLENTGKSPVSSFLYALEPDTKPNLSFIGASVCICSIPSNDINYIC